MPGSREVRHLPPDVGEVCNVSLSSSPEIPGLIPVGFRAEDLLTKEKAPRNSPGGPGKRITVPAL